MTLFCRLILIWICSISWVGTCLIYRQGCCSCFCLKAPQNKFLQQAIDQQHGQIYPQEIIKLVNRCSIFDPIQLIFDGSYGFILIKQTDLKSFRLLIQHSTLLCVLDCVSAQDALRVHHIKTQIHRRLQNQQLDCFIERLIKGSYWSRLSKHPKSDFYFGFLILLHHGWVEIQLKNSASQLTILGREECEFELDYTLFLIFIIKEVTLNRVSDCLVVDKRIDIITALSDFFVALLANDGQSGGIFGNLEQESFVKD